jgi:hypothetical protein
LSAPVADGLQIVSAPHANPDAHEIGPHCPFAPQAVPA